MNLYTAFTNEIDDPELAAKEILEQLCPEKNMRKNTIGIVYFHNSFADDGIWSVFAKAMPFELFGGASSYIGTGERYGDASVSVTMLTGDDVSFAVKSVGGLADKTSETIVGEAKTACEELMASETPKLIIPLWSHMNHFSGDDFIDMTNNLSKRVPFYGMIVLDVSGVPGTNFVLANDTMSSAQFGALAIYGNISPKFRAVTSLDSNINLGSEAVITEAEGNILKSINNMPATEYLKKLGLIDADGNMINSEIWTLPSVMTFPDGRKFVRAFHGIPTGTQYLFSAGRVEAGVKIVFSILDADRTIASAKRMMDDITAAKENDILVLSCLARAWALGAKLMAEIHTVAVESASNNDVPIRYSMAYTGGEICPLKDGDGNPVNVLHNYTLVACAFN